MSVIFNHVVWLLLGFSWRREGVGETERRTLRLWNLLFLSLSLLSLSLRCLFCTFYSNAPLESCHLGRLLLPWSLPSSPHLLSSHSLSLSPLPPCRCRSLTFKSRLLGPPCVTLHNSVEFSLFLTATASSLILRWRIPPLSRSLRSSPCGSPSERSLLYRPSPYLFLLSWMIDWFLFSVSILSVLAPWGSVLFFGLLHIFFSTFYAALRVVPVWGSGFWVGHPPGRANHPKKASGDLCLLLPTMGKVSVGRLPRIWFSAPKIPYFDLENGRQILDLYGCSWASLKLWQNIFLTVLKLDHSIYWKNLDPPGSHLVHS